MTNEEMEKTAFLYAKKIYDEEKKDPRPFNEGWISEYGFDCRSDMQCLVGAYINEWRLNTARESTYIESGTVIEIGSPAFDFVKEIGFNGLFAAERFIESYMEKEYGKEAARKMIDAFDAFISEEPDRNELLEPMLSGGK